MTSDDIKAIRDALAACPHKGAWLHRAKSNGLFTPPPAGTPYTYGTHLTQLGDDAEGAEDGEVIDFIAACHPERIARLLDALEQAQKDAARLDWLDENPDRIRRSTGYLGSASSWTVRDDDGVAHDFMSARAAIDAAMATQAAPPPVHPAAPAAQRTPADPAQP